MQSQPNIVSAAEGFIQRAAGDIGRGVASDVGNSFQELFEKGKSALQQKGQQAGQQIRTNVSNAIDNKAEQLYDTYSQRAMDDVRNIAEGVKPWLIGLYIFLGLIIVLMVLSLVSNHNLKKQIQSLADRETGAIITASSINRV